MRHARWLSLVVGALSAVGCAARPNERAPIVADVSPMPSAPAAVDAAASRPPAAADEVAPAVSVAEGSPGPRQPMSLVRAPGKVVFAAAPGWVDGRRDELRLRAGGDAVWITVDPSSLSIERGSSAAGADPSPARLVRSATGPRHHCLAYQTARPGFTVACLVREGAFRIATADFDDDRRAFPVVSTPGGHVTVFDLSLERSDARATALAYVLGDRGVVVRAEASHLDGEIAPSLSLVSAQQKQTVAMTRRVRWPHRPWIDLFF